MSDNLPIPKEVLAVDEKHPSALRHRAQYRCEFQSYVSQAVEPYLAPRRQMALRFALGGQPSNALKPLLFFQLQFRQNRLAQHVVVPRPSLLALRNRRQ